MFNYIRSLKYPFPDGRVTAGTGCNAVGARGGLPT